MIPIDIRPNPCVTQAGHASVCEISPPCVTYSVGVHRVNTLTATFNYLVDYFPRGSKDLVVVKTEFKTHLAGVTSLIQLVATVDRKSPPESNQSRIVSLDY